jgi:hypothetical protein
VGAYKKGGINDLDFSRYSFYGGGFVVVNVFV